MRTPTKPSDRRGFTLIEMMVVVIIVGVAAAVVFVRLEASIPGHRLRSAAGQIVAAVSTARSEGRLKQREIYLVYDLDENVWTIEAAAEPGNDPIDMAPAAPADTSAAAKAPDAFAETTVEGDDEGAAGVEDGLTEEQREAQRPIFGRGAMMPWYDPEGDTEVLASGAMPDGARMSSVYFGENGLPVVTGKVTATFRASGAVGEHMVILKSDDAEDTLSVFVPALTGAAYMVDEGVTYGQERLRRRLK